MRNQRFKDASGYVSFINLFKQADLEQALLVHRDSDVYPSVWRYYCMYRFAQFPATD
jgi:insecticidal toxin